MAQDEMMATVPTVLLKGHLSMNRNRYANGIASFKLRSVLSLLFVTLCLGFSHGMVVAPNPAESDRLDGLVGMFGTHSVFSGDGRFLLAAGADHAGLWSTETLKLVAQIEIPKGQHVSATKLSTDGSTALVAYGNIGHVSHLNKVKKRAVLLKHRSKILCADLSLDGRFVVTGDDTGVVRIWNTLTGLDVLQRNFPHPVCQVSFSPDSQKILIEVGLPSGKGPSRLKDDRHPEWQHASRIAYLWGWSTGKDLLEPQRLEIFPYRGDESWLRLAVLSPDGRRIATYIGVPAGVVIHDIDTGKIVASIPVNTQTGPGTGFLGRLSFTSDGAWLVVSGTETNASGWDAMTGKPLESAGLGMGATVVSFDQSRKYFAYEHGDGSASLLRTRPRGEEIDRLDRFVGSAERSNLIAFHPFRPWALVMQSDKSFASIVRLGEGDVE